MSVKASVLSQLKSKLRPTVTRVTRADGQVEQEQGQVSGGVSGQVSPGYVVDTAPDLTLSQILPWLYLGSQDVAADLNILRGANISHVLNVASGLDINLGDVTINVKKVELLDIPEQNITEALAECRKYLKFCEESKQSVLVHCNAGVSRSATVVIA